jgi:hypothetical protein
MWKLQEESCCCQILRIYKRILANKLIKEIKGKLPEELYAGWVTTTGIR